jgi:hypothetical protein
VNEAGLLSLQPKETLKRKPSCVNCLTDFY